MRRLLLLLFLAIPLAADEARIPRVFFRTPDPVTKKRITNHLITSKGLGSGTRDTRSDARAELIEIGAWSVPFLADAVHGRHAEKSVRVRMNAVMSLARILDPRCLPALRGAAADDPSAEARQTACLALGLFRAPSDRALLHRLLTEKDHKRRQQITAAFALAKLHDKDAASILRANAHNPGTRKPRLVAAMLLSATIATPDTEPVRYLRHKERLLRAIAAVGLMVRPTGDAAPIFASLRGREDRHVRALQYAALAAIEDRSPEIREKLLDCAVKTKEKEEARIAALVGLAYERNIVSNYKELAGLYRNNRGRNDPLLAALLHALARSGAPQAVDDLLKVIRTQSPFLQFYAAGSLLHLVGVSEQGHPREGDIRDTIDALGRNDSDRHLTQIIELNQTVWAERDAKLRREKLLAGLAEIQDPKGLHLWDWTARDRAWAAANRMLPVILELDDIADKGDPLGRPYDESSQKVPVESGSTGTARTSATPEEQDLLAFLGEIPYFGPADLGSG